MKQHWGLSPYRNGIYLNRNASAVAVRLSYLALSTQEKKNLKQALQVLHFVGGDAKSQWFRI